MSTVPLRRLPREGGDPELGHPSESAKQVWVPAFAGKSEGAGSAPHAEPVEAPLCAPFPSAAFPAKAGIQSVDYRSRKTILVPPREGGDCAGKAEGG